MSSLEKLKSLLALAVVALSVAILAVALDVRSRSKEALEIMSTAVEFQGSVITSEIPGEDGAMVTTEQSEGESIGAWIDRHIVALGAAQRRLRNAR
jgi:hypothetical protein